MPRGGGRAWRRVRTAGAPEKKPSARLRGLAPPVDALGRSERESIGDSGIQSWNVPSAELTPLGRLTRGRIPGLGGMATDSVATPDVTPSMELGPGIGFSQGFS